MHTDPKMETGLYRFLGAVSWLSLAGFFVLSVGITLHVVYRTLCGSLLHLCIAILYAVWYWHDRHAPFDGRSHRSAVFMRAMRPLLRAACAYHKTRLIKDYDQEDAARAVGDRPLMLCCHPHGIFSMGILANFGLTGGTALFTHPVTVLTLDLQFMVPIWRDFCLALGFASVSSRSVEHLLRRGMDLAIVLGGARESLDARPGHTELTIRPRRGFFRLALRHGAAIVPVLTYGETDVYWTYCAPWLRRIQDRLLRMLSVAFPVFVGRYGLVPRSTHLTTVLGAPLIVEKTSQPPTLVEIVHLQERYIEALHALHAKHGKSHHTIFTIK